MALLVERHVIGFFCSAGLILTRIAHTSQREVFTVRVMVTTWCAASRRLVKSTVIRDSQKM